jgi:hypothetical protein
MIGPRGLARAASESGRGDFAGLVGSRGLLFDDARAAAGSGAAIVRQSGGFSTPPLIFEQKGNAAGILRMHRAEGGNGSSSRSGGHSARGFGQDGGSAKRHFARAIRRLAARDKYFLSIATAKKNGRSYTYPASGGDLRWFVP